MTKCKTLDVTKPSLMLHTETTEIDVYVLSTAHHRTKKHTRPDEYWYGPSIITVTRSAIGSVSELEEWPSAPLLWPWLQALAGIGLWAMKTHGEEIPADLMAYWQRPPRISGNPVDVV